MTLEFSHETYLSPFTWRYGSNEMRRIWSEVYRRRLWRRIWVALARAQARAGLITDEQVADLEAHMDDIDLRRSFQIEQRIRHDVMAEIETYAEQCPIGGGIIHLGATSTDITDNADILRFREAIRLILKRLQELIVLLAEKVDEWADVPCMGFTHLQPAEPVTVGYRFAVTLQDLLEDYLQIHRLLDNLRAKGFRGAVGTRASYMELLSSTSVSPEQMEMWAMEELGLQTYTVTTQVYPRKQDWLILCALEGIAQTLYRFAFDLRLLQSPVIGEWAEPFGQHQVGSSAMPFKRNPVNAENVDSLTRFISHLPGVLWDNAAHSLLERTLDDSANRRVVLSEAFLAVDEALMRTQRILRGIEIDETQIRQTLERYGRFAATERVLMAAVKAGGDRQVLHAVIRKHSLEAWRAVKKGDPNPLPQLLQNDPLLRRYLSPEQIGELLDARTYVGDAPQRARMVAAKARETVI